jgi:hypothetical protein
VWGGVGGSRLGYDRQADRQGRVEFSGSPLGDFAGGLQGRAAPMVGVELGLVGEVGRSRWRGLVHTCSSIPAKSISSCVPQSAPKGI